jgi:hypothetical protein
MAISQLPVLLEQRPRQAVAQQESVARVFPERPRELGALGSAPALKLALVIQQRGPLPCSRESSYCI